MKKKKRITLSSISISLLILSVVIFYIFDFYKFDNVTNIIVTIGYFVLTAFLINEIIHWTKRGKRGESFDLIVLGFLFVLVFLTTEDILNSFIGAVSIYLLFGIMELKDYEVLNKILIITVVTYNFIFFAGLINSYLKSANIIETDVIRDTAFSMSFWIMLILGFALFGRKYIVVFRFLSPQYLSLFLFILAWMAVRVISKWFFDITEWIYLALILVNWLIYFISGPILDFTLGIKRTDNEKLHKIVENVIDRIDLKGKVKVGFGKYPILNAMAYGAWFDKRIAVIAPDIKTFPEDEITGIIAHELSHTRGAIKNIPDTLTLTIISTIQLLLFWLLGWPATVYDYTFNPEGQPFPLWVFLLINIGLSVIIYVFVRILEGFADLNSKRVGLGNQLAKGLYNLEGFYSRGREIGLDTMLLSDEEISENTKKTNYADTAQYLKKNMHYPKRLTLLSNLLNSHPPTYHRIISMYGEEKTQLKPLEESVLPISLMTKMNRRIFAQKHKKAQEKYRAMANLKYKVMFNIDDYSRYLDNLNKKELFKQEIGKRFIFIDKESLRIITGKLVGIRLNDDITNPYSFEIRPINFNLPENIVKKFKKGNKIDRETLKLALEHYEKRSNNKLEQNLNLDELVYLNIMDISMIEIDIGSKYQLKDKYSYTLIGLSLPDLENSNQDSKINSADTEPLTKKKYKEIWKKFQNTIKENGKMFFLTSENQIFTKKITDKIGFNLNYLGKAVGKEIFLEDKGTLLIMRLKEYIEGSTYDDSIITIENERYTVSDNIGEDSKDLTPPSTLELQLNNIIIKKEEFGVAIHNDIESARFEYELLSYLKENQIRTTIYLKKAINNQESGYIQAINEDNAETDSKTNIVIRTIYGESKEFNLSKIESVIFAHDTIAIRDKEKMSLGEKIVQFLVKWRKPHTIFNP
ncbi:MAG: M48 family metalloprotease [Candidatus Lokiarchaeota archaeon]|nr:M48 family metalloprotease [Candidatus Lokiarchaeota archaeon]